MNKDTKQSFGKCRLLTFSGAYYTRHQGIHVSDARAPRWAPCDKERVLAAISLILIIDHSLRMRNIWPITMFTTPNALWYSLSDVKYS